MSVKDIIQKHLVDNGFDGLYSGEGCGCEISNLFICNEITETDVGGCKPGYKGPCDPEECKADGDCPWHIGPDKPDKEVAR